MLGLKYPKNKLDDLNILIGFKLINKTNDNLFIANPIPKPEEVLDFIWRWIRDSSWYEVWNRKSGFFLTRLLGFNVK